MSLAQRQIFSPADWIGPVPDGVRRRSLQRVLCELLNSEINAGSRPSPSTFVNADLKVTRLWRQSPK